MIKKFEQFNITEHKKGDIISIDYNGNVEIAKIVKIYTPFSFIVHLKKNNTFIPKNIEINKDSIISTLKKADGENMTTNWIKYKSQQVSNDMVLHNIADQPVINIMPY